MTTVYTYTDARQNLAALLDKAAREGEVRIKRRDGQVFVVRPETVAGSPLDVAGVELRLTHHREHSGFSSRKAGGIWIATINGGWTASQARRAPLPLARRQSSERLRWGPAHQPETEPAVTVVRTERSSDRPRAR
jgi:antitoxin Phd